MTKNDVLSLLRGQTAPISGQKIAEKLNISRTAVWKAVEALRADGYEIDSQPHAGYRLRHLTTRLSADEIGENLSDHPWENQILVMDSVESTNDLAKQLASSGAPEGTAVLAERQTKGRGRLGRSFASPGGQGIYLSVILRPKVRPTQLLHLTAAAAEAIAEAVEQETGIHPGIKWVNDLVVGERKLAGILTELSVELESGMVNYIVLGIGINCCQIQEDFPEEIRNLATSVRMCMGTNPDRNALAARMLRSLAQLTETLLTGQEDWMRRYAQRCVTIGKQVQVIGAAGIREAKALGINEDAALEVEYLDGTHAWIASGEVSVRGMYGYIT